MKRRLKGKSLICIVGAVLALGMLLSSCSAKNENKAGGVNADVSSKTVESEVIKKDYPEIDLNPKTVYGGGPNGERAASPAEFSLTEDEKALLRAGKYTAAFCYHIQSDQCNQTKVKAATSMLNSVGIEVVSVTDANFKVEKQIADIESTMALKPDVLFIMPVDPGATSKTIKDVIATGTKIVFMENIANDMVAGVDYIGCVNSDSYGNGKAAAEMMAQQLDYEGEVAMVFYDAAFFVTNERDRGFKETIEKEYPGIKIVSEVGFADSNRVGEVADGIFANFPNIKGVYASWDVPGESVIASARSVGREDIVITTVDLGDNTARMIASNGIIRGTAAPRSYDQGLAEAMLACYGLLGKELPSTYVSPPTLPVMRENVIEAYKTTYHLTEAPSWLVDAYESTE